MKIVLLDAKNNFLAEELLLTLNNNSDFEVFSLDPPSEDDGSLQEFFMNIKKIDPDLIFMVNGMHFDDLRPIAKFIDENKIATVNWIVDSPYFMNEKTKITNSKYFFVFCFDKAYLPYMKNDGYANVYELPLAASTCPIPELKSLGNTHFPILFIGSVGLKKVEALKEMFCKVQNQHFVDKQTAELFLQRIAQIAEAFIAQSENQPVTELFRKTNLKLKGTFDWNTIALLGSYTDFIISSKKRVDLVKPLVPMGINVIGDEEWQSVLSPDSCLNKVPYQHIKAYYQCADIVLNVSRTQLLSTMNQRVYDCAASKTFLLTDYKSELDDFFKIDEEVICYKNLEDLKKKAAYYLENPKERQKVIEKAYARVMSEHTVEHRLKKIIEVLKSHQVLKNQDH